MSKIPELKINIKTFEDLKQICADDNENIAINVTKNQALGICQQSLSGGSGVGQQIFNLWVKKLLNIYYNNRHFDAADWHQFVALFKDALEDDMLITAIPATKVKDIQNWLCDTLEFVQWWSTKKDLSILSACILFDFVLIIIVKILGFLRKWNIDNELQQKTIRLHHYVLNILNEYNFIIENQEEFTSFNEVIKSLCEIGEQSTGIDIRTIIDTWKCIVKLMKYCTKSGYFQTTTTTTTAWARRPIKFLLKEITRMITIVYREETLKEPLEKIQKCLKVTNFYVEILYKLTLDFKHSLFPIVDEFFHTLAVAVRLPKNIDHKQLADILDKHARRRLCTVFSMIYKHCDMPEIFFCYMKKNKWETFFNIVRVYLIAAIEEQDIEFIDSNIKTYITIFEKIFTNSTIFTSNQNAYNVIIELFAALTILNVNSQLKKFFMTKVFGADFKIAHASVDILLIVSKYLVKNKTILPKQILKEYNFWSQCNASYAVFSCKINDLHVQTMLRHHFNLCADTNGEIIRNSLCSKEREKFIETNYKFLLNIDLMQINEDKANFIKFHCQQLNDEMLKLLQTFEVNQTKECYYKMLIYIALLTKNRNHCPTDKLLQQLFDIIAKLYKNFNGSLDKLTPLLNMALELVLNHISKISAFHLQKILLLIKDILDVRINLITVTIVDFLIACTKQADIKFQEIAHSTLQRMKTRKHFKIINFILTDNKNCTYKSCKVNNIELYDTLAMNKIPIPHICTNKSSEKVQQNNHYYASKRPRLNDKNDNDNENAHYANGSEYNLKYFINELYVNSNKVVKLHKLADSEDIDMLNTIVNNLQSVISK